MAESEYTAAPEDGNQPGDDDEEIREYRRSLVADRERRQRSATLLGEQAVARVAQQLRMHDEELAQPASAVQLPSKPPASSARATWSAPNEGKKIRTARELELRTIEDCRSGFKATWGYDMTEADRDFFGKVVADYPAAMQAIEAEARGIYSDLRQAISAAASFAERTHNQTYGSATVALGDLWGRLPLLPEHAKLPGYVKLLPARRSLIESWQDIASRQLGRRLLSRELAELSVLLGVFAGGYAAFFRPRKGERALHVTTAEVLRKEAKAIERLLAEPTAHG